jgi:hypothetical protein
VRAMGRTIGCAASSIVAVAARTCRAPRRRGLHGEARLLLLMEEEEEEEGEEEGEEEEEEEEEKGEEKGEEEEEEEEVLELMLVELPARGASEGCSSGLRASSAMAMMPTESPFWSMSWKCTSTEMDLQAFLCPRFQSPVWHLPQPRRVRSARKRPGSA